MIHNQRTTIKEVSVIHNQITRIKEVSVIHNQITRIKEVSVIHNQRRRIKEVSVTHTSYYTCRLTLYRSWKYFSISCSASRNRNILFNMVSNKYKMFLKNKMFIMSHQHTRMRNTLLSYTYIV